MKRLRCTHTNRSLWVQARIAGGVIMSSTTVTADAKFLRRVFLGLVGLTLFTGGMAALAVAQTII
jgi:hypothetical protein